MRSLQPGTIRLTGETRMAIIVKKIEDDLYSVSATLPDVDEEWLPAEPVRGRQLVRELS
jgi:hypothetical protein